MGIPSKAGMPTRATFIFRPKKRREGPVEQFLIGLRDFAIEKVVSRTPPVFEARWTGKNTCPHCAGEKLRIKDSFWRTIRNISIHGRASRLLIRCHKYRCEECGRYFNTRLAGINVWSRTTELLKRNIFQAYNKGISCKDIADEHRIGVASVERYYHQMMQHKSSHWVNRTCPRILGIDEHRFTRRQCFATTFCDLARRRVFDVVKGRSAADMRDFLQSLHGRHKVKMVCIDMNSAYRRLVREWFPNARIVADRFHVIRLVNQHFSELCKAIDEKQLAHGRGGMMRLLLTRRDRLTDSQKERLRTYFAGRPDIGSLHEFLHDTADLLRVRAQSVDSCRKYVAELLNKIDQLRNTPFAPLRTLGRTLHNWREEVARMFRFTRNNGITEGFHRKMKLIQRRAYGFRNFENYRLRVRVLCC